MSKERLIVVAADDACGFDGEVSSHLGSCPFFLLAEANGSIVTVSTVLPNPGFETQRPGATPHFIHDLGADVIIAGDMEPQTIDAFHDFGIDVATGATGSVEAVLGAYVRGEHLGVVPCDRDHPDSRGRPGQEMGA